MDKVKILLYILILLGISSLVFAEDLSLHGSLQTNYAVRVVDGNPEEAKQGNIISGEERVQIKGSYYPSKSSWGVFVKTDFYHDAVEEDFKVDFREGYLDYTRDKVNLRIGRQIITWGVGDMLFINDTFPKNWEAFYSGRPLEYLKKGIDAANLNFYGGLANLEFIIIPHFTADNLPSVGRFHFFDPYPTITDREVDKPQTTFDNTEYALRIYRSWNGFDLSGYTYKGFYRDPGMKADNFNSPTAISQFYPKLAVYGLSAQKNGLGGVVSTEYGYYDSLDDRNGKDPGVNNSQSRFLIGYQKAFPNDFTGGIQYYGELMHQYRQYEDNLPATFAKIKQLHQYVTLRLTKFLKYQTMKLSLFTFYSPDEEDFLIIPEANYNFTDNLLGVIGMNIFAGAKDNTTFGQQKNDSNIYVTVRYSF